MFVFQKFYRALFSRYLRLEIRPFALAGLIWFCQSQDMSDVVF